MSTNEARTVLRKRLNSILDDRWPLAGKIMAAVDEYVAHERSAGAAPRDLPTKCVVCDGPHLSATVHSYEELREYERLSTTHECSAGAAPLELLHAEFIEARDSFEVDTDAWAVWNTAATRVRSLA